MKRKLESIESDVPAKKKKPSSLVLSKAKLSWDERFDKLKAFKEQHGHREVTLKYERETAPGCTVGLPISVGSCQ